MQCPSSMAVPLNQVQVLIRPRSATPHKQPQFPSSVSSHSNSVIVKQHFWSDNECLSLGIRPSLSLTRRMVGKASPEGGKVVASEEDDDGVSLGTMKLPSDTDLVRFETLLFQWANSLCQGANLPLPVPLKVDKIPGGARLGFITVGDGETQVLVYIDCLVFPADDDSPVPIFRAIRNGPLKDQPPPGEPRIMRSLLGALKTSVEIARL